ncbi:exonuclease [Toxoplasma gondii GT1]|uniref:Exonuclease n=1 Tax=Toxoplasma gondii (strain ATCC 50853 / GT1) TaxID=507601 RepID=S7W5C6_TOXGG|nr:exonuclease [Toxoplasma gondii GT1]
MRALKRHRSRRSTPNENCPDAPSPHLSASDSMATSELPPSKRALGRDDKPSPPRSQPKKWSSGRDELTTEADKSCFSVQPSHTEMRESVTKTDLRVSQTWLPSGSAATSRDHGLPGSAIESNASLRNDTERGRGARNLCSYENTAGCRAGQCARPGGDASISAGEGELAWQTVKPKKQQRPSVSISRQKGQQRPDIDSLHQFLRWLVWQKFSGGPAASGNKARRHPDASGSCGALEKSPPWLRITQPHLVGAVVVAVLPYVDLAVLRFLQLEGRDRLAELLDQVVETRRQAWRKAKEEEVCLYKTELRAEATTQGGDVSGGGEKFPGIAFSDPSEGTPCASASGSDSLKLSHDGEGQTEELEEAHDSDMLLDRRGRSTLLPNGYSSLLQFLASPSGPKIPTRFIRVESGQHCSIVRSCFSSLVDARTFRDVDVTHLKTAANYDPSYYLLTLDEMKSNNFPLPEMSGNFPTGYTSIHAHLVYPPTWDGRVGSCTVESTIPSTACSRLPPSGRDAFSPSSASSSAAASCAPQSSAGPSSVAPVSVEQFFALDCEMVLTKLGTEVGRVSVIDSNGTALLDVFVRPKGPIIDYLTRFSGLEERHLASAELSLEDVHRRLSQILPPEAVLVGHSLENDLHALKLVHLRCIDTSILYPHAILGLKNSLKRLVNCFLPEQKLRRERGHDSLEDARATLNLAKLKVQRGPEFGVLSKQYEPLGRALRAVASRALRCQQQTREDISPNERLSSGCELSLSCGQPDAFPPSTNTASMKKSGSREKPEMCVPMEVDRIVTTVSPNTAVSRHRAEANNSGHFSADRHLVSREVSSSSKSCNHTDLTNARACDSNLCQPAKSEDPRLNLILVDSFLHPCTEAFRGTRVFLEKNDEDVVKTCLRALNVSRKQPMLRDTSLVDGAKVSGRSQNLRAVPCGNTQLIPDTSDQRAESHIPHVGKVNAALGECEATARSNARRGDRRSVLSSESLSVGQKSVATPRGEVVARPEAPAQSSVFEERERRSSQRGGSDREGRQCCLQESQQRDTFFPIGVCVLRSYQRMCNRTAGIPRAHLYAFNRRAQNILRLQQKLRTNCVVRRHSETLQHLDGRWGVNNVASRAENGARGNGNACTDDVASGACTEVPTETEGAFDVHVEGQRRENPARIKGSSGKIDPDRDLSRESETSDDGDEAAQVDEKDILRTCGYGLTQNPQLLFPSVCRKDALSALLELDDLLFTLLAGLRQNDLLILVSPCGNAARYLSLAALRSALSSGLGGTQRSNPAEAEVRHGSSVSDGTNSDGSPSHPYGKMCTGACEATQTTLLQSQAIDQEFLTEQRAPVKTSTALESVYQLDNAFPDINSSGNGTFPELTWTSSMERELEKARGTGGNTTFPVKRTSSKRLRLIGPSINGFFDAERDCTTAHVESRRNNQQQGDASLSPNVPAYGLVSLRDIVAAT